jgi:hypothetical protein
MRPRPHRRGHGLVNSDGGFDRNPGQTIVQQRLRYRRNACITIHAWPLRPLRMELRPRRPLMLGLMNELDTDKLDWVRSLPAGPPAKDGLAHIVDADGGHDDAENSYYQTAAHPAFVQIEAARRRFRGQYLRQPKRPAEHAWSSGI